MPKEPLYTDRLAHVYIGQWAIHTGTGQIGQVVDWDTQAISFRVWGSTRNQGDAQGRGFTSVDDKDMFRAATGYEICGYVNGDWSWHIPGQDVTGSVDPRDILTPGVPALPTQELPAVQNIEKIVESTADASTSIVPVEDVQSESLTSGEQVSAQLGLEQLHAKVDRLTQMLEQLLKYGKDRGQQGPNREQYR